MNAAVVKKTQDTLGKVIKKPPLTEKLLSRPPFRYLHDIFSEVIRTTGFMKGLYEENEMKSDSVKDKDSKMFYLQKAIDVVMLVSGEPLAAKPARIVAGHEPEKTNELLQAIAKCCLNKLSSDEAVKRVLAGEKVDLKSKGSTSRSQGKENRDGKERPPDKDEKKKIERSSSQEHKDPNQGKEQESRHKDKEDHRDHERTERHHRSEKDHQDKSRDQERERDKGRVRDRDRDRDKEKTRERDSHRDRGQDKRRDKDREREGDQSKDWNEKNRSEERENDKARVSEKPQQRAAKTVPADLKPVEEPTDVVENQSGNPARIPRPSSAKGQRQKPKVESADESDSEGDGDVQLAQRAVPQENGESEESSVPDKTARRVARPPSARPAPPRVRRQESNTEGTPAERLSSAKPTAPIILDGKRASDDEEDEDEQFLVMEAVTPHPDSPKTEAAHEFDADEKHGGLVKKILETKKDYELTPSSSKSKEQNLVSETARKKDRELVMREIDRLRSSIQMVCRSSLPLGKIMDYIQEDVDAMQAELQSWRRENKEHAQALLQEQRITDRAVEPLSAELAELDQLIKDQQDKICAVKSNILKNEEKIQKMVTGINFSSRT
ncbi:TRAF3-interacting protein 1 isoform X3 [Gambusia affinis]|uniref:TRAF3-interacting protein 1 isoform X3 n=1 Tax=Gambusia affinis TaxID=33528 RepID=UPI001CDC9C91|nr:TRAF3-interacting protein 1 isoform X3 [Gambusia affinis]